jgi:glutathione synthase/RimK-type ligase-like ATP-grasp enzyme
MSVTDQKLSTAELLFNQAAQMGLQPSWVTQNWLFAIQTPQGERYINNTSSMLNSQVAASLSRNKYLTRKLLERQGLPNVPFARPKTTVEARLFLENYHKIIVKPNTGAGAHDIRIVESPVQLVGVPLADSIFEQYITGKEMRYLVLDGQVVSVHESRYGTSVAADRYLERIAYEQANWHPERAAMAVQIAAMLGLRFAAVDYLVTESGAFYVLEVNSSPGLKWFHAPTAGPSIDIAALFMQAIMA